VDAEALLLIEVDGPRSAVMEEAEKIASICKASGGDVSIAEDVFSKQRIWMRGGRYQPLFTASDRTKINEDIVVPRGEFPKCSRR